ncbi:MAG TPA: SDR family oxidoreductase [Niabella sp.]|nr:SDR family oxidoreductase [Niabella sp.]HOZ96297.1 SDR family oxidoreductase [Niabella sp.]HQX41132.1 SDR family oxidoreductase [Niabella sp.]HRB42119.1 SDR family oxidoreductase [Niabella sp.]HRB48090.1 SDR family oxidoreductase [Niabella sp.]
MKNKIAILTGASRGLGAAMAHALTAKEVKVYGLARNKQRLDALKQNLGENFYPVAIDITNETDIKNWVQQTFSTDYSPDILINNAGVGSFHQIDEMTSDNWYSMINTNLNGMYLITAPLAGLMKKKPGVSHIINIGSILGKTGRTDSTAYCTTKFGVQGFSEALYQELRHFNIKVTCVSPGSIETDFFNSSGVMPHDNMLHPEDIAQTVVHILETPDNMLINDITIRPLNPKPKTQNQPSS